MVLSAFFAHHQMDHIHWYQFLTVLILFRWYELLTDFMSMTTSTYLAAIFDV